MTGFKFSRRHGFFAFCRSSKAFIAVPQEHNSSFCKSRGIRSAVVATSNFLRVYSFKLVAQILIRHFLCAGHQQGLQQVATAYWISNRHPAGQGVQSKEKGQGSTRHMHSCMVQGFRVPLTLSMFCCWHQCGAQHRGKRTVAQRMLSAPLHYSQQEYVGQNALPR